MRKHILHVSLGNDVQAELAKRLSDRFGNGNGDYAICYGEQIKKCFFLHCLDFKKVATNRPEECWDMSTINLTIDERDLAGVLPYALQSIIMMERHAYAIGKDVDARIRVYLHNIQFWNGFLKQNVIDLVVFYTYPHEVYDFFIYQICKAIGIQTLIVGYSIVESRNYCIRSIEDNIPELKERYLALLEESRSLSMEDITLSPSYRDLFAKMTNPEADRTPYYMKNLEQQMQQVFAIEVPKEDMSIKEKLLKAGRLITHPDWKEIKDAAIHIPRAIDAVLFKGYFMKKQHLRSSLRFRMTQELDTYYDLLSVQPDYDSKYVYFPLHYQPECTSNPNGGGMYCVQSIPIRILSNSLPSDVHIYVKEHPKQVYGARTKEFYDELLTIPQVVLIKKNTDTYELIENCLAVSTLIGTAGWEGLFRFKPFIMFGYGVMQHAPGVYHVRTKAECRKAVDEILGGRCTFTLKDLKLFFKAMDETQGYSLYGENDPAFDRAKAVSSTYAMLEKLLTEDAQA